MQPDQTPEGGKFRLRAAQSLDGTLGVWGADDMLCVAIDGDGRFVPADPDNAIGVVWSTESRRTRHYTPPQHTKRFQGGDKYTVIFQGEFVEAEVEGVGEPDDNEFEPTILAAGDLLYADDDGGVTTDPVPGAVFIGFVAEGGNRLVIIVNGLPVAVGS